MISARATSVPATGADRSGCASRCRAKAACSCGVGVPRNPTNARGAIAMVEGVVTAPNVPLIRIESPTTSNRSVGSPTVPSASTARDSPLRARPSRPMR
jgi:hypothetical protein